MFFNETFFGLLFHNQLRKFSTFQYEDEKPDYKPPERYLPGHKSKLTDKQLTLLGGDGAKPSDSQHGGQSTPSSMSAGGQEEVIGSRTNDKEMPPSLKDNQDPYLVDWYDKNDGDNPLLWNGWKKGFFLTQIMILTTTVYMGSSIVSPALPLMARYWGIGITPASLSLSLFVFGNGVGPMIGICSASEIASIGRAFPYVISLFLFVILQVPTAIIDSLAGHMILRFLAGLVGSPPLATGGASIQDIFSPVTAPLGLGLWCISASAGPVLGPLVGGFATQGFQKIIGITAWRWTIWPLLIATGSTLVLLIFFMPETSSQNILLRRAKRLRKATGNPNLRSKGELLAEQMTRKELVLMTFVRPFRLGFFEPIALAINLHIGLVYAILYSFFESFPIVFTDTYGFNLGESGLAFIGILVGNMIVYCFFACWFVRYYRPKLIEKKGQIPPELWLQPAMLGGLCLPASLFFFGWTANKDIHWIVPILGTMLFSPGIFGLFTSGLNYLAVSYPDYVASVFSPNDFLRTSLGAAMPLVSRQMFHNLDRGPKAFPVAWGCTLLGCLALLMAPIPYMLAHFGPALRKRSPFCRDPMADGNKEKENGAE